MELTDKELECIKYFPRRARQYPLYFSDYFKLKVRRISGITKKQLQDNTRKGFHTHEPLLNESLKIIGKNFLVTDTERHIEFSVRFFDDIGYEIYINKDNDGENRLHFLSDLSYEKISISDLQSEKLLSPDNYEMIKENLLIYMNTYRRYEIFRWTIAWYLGIRKFNLRIRHIWQRIHKMK